MKNEVVLVDENNQPVGVAEKLEAHRKGWLHRGFSVFIFNSAGELLIQRRNPAKYHSGGLWSNTVCSHPAPGESLADAVHRRLIEEMGFDCEFEEVGCFQYRVEFEDGLIENEWDYILSGRYDGEVKSDPEEVSEFRWIKMTELGKDIAKNPDKYTFWFKKILKENLLHRRK